MKLEKLINFLVEVGELKELSRTGWVLRNVKNPDSVADHTFRLAIMAWVLADETLDKEKLMKMALLHDLPEVYAGDATPYDDLIEENPQRREEIMKKWPGRSKKEKKERNEKKRGRESEALEKLIRDLPESVRREAKALWLEYRECASQEARFLRQIDKIENLLQALKYKETQPDFPIKPFWIEVWGLVDNPRLVEFLGEIDKYFRKSS